MRCSQDLLWCCDLGVQGCGVTLLRQECAYRGLAIAGQCLGHVVHMVRVGVMSGVLQVQRVSGAGASAFAGLQHVERNADSRHCSIISHFRCLSARSSHSGERFSRAKTSCSLPPFSSCSAGPTNSNRPLPEKSRTSHIRNYGVLLRSGLLKYTRKQQKSNEFGNGRPTFRHHCPTARAYHEVDGPYDPPVWFLCLGFMINF